MDKIQGEFEKLNEADAPTPSSQEEVAQYEVGGVLNARDQEVVVYETEDGEVVSDFDESEYEVIEVVEGQEVLLDQEPEPDPDDEDFEYVWVEETVSDAPFEPEEPTDTY